MPYYCTVPRCTSMAGKAKNVSFHQFPRDEELAKLWNRILKRGKPYTKYSKVCSLHFKPEDYTITSVGKNKGQWRTLRKDAIPSQNLPSESPAPYTRRSSGCWVPSQPNPNLTDPLVQQQMARAIYMQTMLAMQAAGASDAITPGEPPQTSESTKPSPSSSSLSEMELLLRRDTDTPKDVTFKCHECSKCFKDPDVFLLHKRTHKNDTKLNIEKENYSANIQDREETLRANPILANLLKTSMRLEPESNMANILTVENTIMAALASNMEAYIRTLSSLLASQTNAMETEDNDRGSDYDETKDDDDSKERDAVNGKANDMFGKGDCVDTNERDTPMDEDGDGAHINRTEDQEIQDENEDDGMQDESKEDILNHFINQTESENRVETPGEDDSKYSSEPKSIDDNYTTKDENWEVRDDTQIDENQSISDDKSIHNDNNVRDEMNEASNDNHTSTSSSKTDSPTHIVEVKNDANEHENYECPSDNKILNETENEEYVKEDTTDENHIYTAEDTSRNEVYEVYTDTLLDGNHKYESDAIDDTSNDEMVNDNDGRLVQGVPTCDSDVDTVEFVKINIEFET